MNSSGKQQSVTRRKSTESLFATETRLVPIRRNEPTNDSHESDVVANDRPAEENMLDTYNELDDTFPFADEYGYDLENLEEIYNSKLNERTNSKLSIDDEHVSSSNYDSSSDEKVVFHYSMRQSHHHHHVSKRRRSKVENRARKKSLMLYYSGSHDTNYWCSYGIKPDDVSISGNILAVDTLFTDDEFNKLGLTERRIHIHGQKFKVAFNQAPGDSMYRAIAQAVGTPENKHIRVQKQIMQELSNDCLSYLEELCSFCSVSKMEINSLMFSPKKIIERYKREKRRVMQEKCPCPPELELKAAASHYGFTYTIVEFYDIRQPVSIRTCNDSRIVHKATTKYYFLLTGKNTENACYELMLPIGPPKKLRDGKYLAIYNEVILVEKHRPWLSQGQTRYTPPTSDPIPIGFALDHRIFFYLSTISHDLWSLLAELMYKKLSFAPQIKQKIINSKHNFSLFYLACKAKKRYQRYGNASTERIEEEFSRRFSCENPRGDLEDLTHAATYFNFSYTVIGLDANGNFFWKDHVANASESSTNLNIPYLAFFVKTTPERATFWYALEDLGRDCPEECKLYKNVDAGNLSEWNGKFYFHYYPEYPEDASVNLEPVPTQILDGATTWASKSITKLRTSLANVISKTAGFAKKLSHSIFGFFKWMKNRRKVQPDKTLHALYVREKP